MITRPGLLLTVSMLLLAPACGEVSAPDAPSAAALEEAIAEALGWFQRAQEKDGSFSLHRWNPHHGRSGLPGFSEEDHWLDVAATGLVVLAFAESGHPSIRSEADSCYRRALRWLLKRQIEGGRFGYYESRVDNYFVTRIRKHSLYSEQGAGYKARTIHMFNHAVPTAALAVAYRATRDATLRAPLRAALRHLAHDEHTDYVWTSYYDPYGDMGVVSYVVLAARAAADAGLGREALPLLEPALDFLGRVTDPESGRAAMLADHPHCFDGDDSTAILAFCRRLLGETATTPPLSGALAGLARTEPAWRPAIPPDHGFDLERSLGPVVNHETWYHGVHAMAAHSGQAAARFRAQVTGLLVAHQRRDGPKRGSWDPVGIWARIGGRIYATSMAVRTLAVPLRGRTSRPLVPRRTPPAGQAGSSPAGRSCGSGG